jgi:hypothetical protein
MKRFFIALAAVLLVAAPAYADNYVHAYKSEAEIRNYFSETATAANVLNQTECGKTLFLSTTGHATTLPTPTIGCTFKFIVATASQGFTIITSGAELIKGLGFETDDASADYPTTAGADTITFVSGTAKVGDRAEVVSDGTYWYVVTFTSSDGGVTFTSAI